MFLFRKSNRVANITIDDYVIRMVENNGKDLESIQLIAEKELPHQLIVKGKIMDELAFYHFMKDVVLEWGIKHCGVRFYVPHELIIMRDVQLPEDVDTDQTRQYITMEIGNTIHFPFSNPVFDIYQSKELSSENKVTVLAAPEEEITKYVEIFDDVKLKPLTVDAQALGVYRFFLDQQGSVDENKVYLLFELNLTSVNISIFHQYEPEFLRYQPLNISIDDWIVDDYMPLHWKYKGDEERLVGEVEDQLNEIDRLMNFYRYSIHQGEREVSDIILAGDYPDFHHVQKRLEERYALPVTTLSTEHIVVEQQMTRAFIPALGLALKGR